MFLITIGWPYLRVHGHAQEHAGSEAKLNLAYQGPGWCLTPHVAGNRDTLYWIDLAADFPETAGRIGTFTVELVEQFSTTLTGFSLRFAGNGAFTVVTPFGH